MLKKFSLVSVPLFLFLFAFVLPVFSEGSAFDLAYDNYILANDIYTNKHVLFKNARDFYVQNQTLSLKEDVRIKTKDMLRARDELTGSYLMVLKERLNQFSLLDSSVKSGAISKLDKEIGWYKTHKEVILDNESLDSLFNRADESEKQYLDSTRIAISQARAATSLGKFVDMRVHELTTYELLEHKIRELAGTRRELYDRWIEDNDRLFEDLKKTASDTIFLFEKFDTGSASKAYLDVITKLSSKLEDFNQINNNLHEMLNSRRLP